MLREELFGICELIIRQQLIPLIRHSPRAMKATKQGTGKNQLVEIRELLFRDARVYVCRGPG